MSSERLADDLSRRTLLIVICWSLCLEVNARRYEEGPTNYVAHWSWMRCAAALGIMAGETYRQPQATSQFRMILSIILNWKKKKVSSLKLQAVDNLKKEFDICRTVLYKVIIAFIANAAQDGRQLKLDEARRLVHKTCVARRTART